MTGPFVITLFLFVFLPGMVLAQRAEEATSREQDEKSSEARAPRWKVAANTSARTFTITVDTRGLARNESLVEAKCRMRYIDASSKPLEERTYEITVPIAQGVSKPQTFQFDNSKASSIRGVMMDWRVLPMGAYAKDERAPSGRRGSTPPDDEDGGRH